MGNQVGSKLNCARKKDNAQETVYLYFIMPAILFIFFYLLSPCVS